MRLIIALIAMAGALWPPPATAESVAFDAFCHAVTGTATPDSALPRLTFACRGAPSAYQQGSLWLRTDLRDLSVDRTDVALMVRQSRFDRLAVAFTYADGHVVWQQVASGAFGAHWRVGGQIAFEAPVRDASLVAATMRLDRVASHNLLRIRIITGAESATQSAILAALTGAALMLLLVGVVYNMSLAIAVRRQFLLWHGLWAACVLTWGTLWSQLELIVLPGLAGTTAARICTFLACAAITAATVSAVTSIERSLLPRWATTATLALGIAIGVLGIPTAIVRGAAIDGLGQMLDLLVLADLAAVALLLGWAWRRGCTVARDVALAWSVPMAALGFIQIVDVGGALWGGGSQMLVLFAAALQTMWLAIAITRRIALLRVERDRARAAEKRASALAGRDPLTNLYNRRGFIARTTPLLGAERPAEVPVALLLIDVDRFKSVNDAYGHEAGDIVLCNIARRLQRWESVSCAVARLGGEEFALAITGIDGFALVRFADSVRQELGAIDHGAVIGERPVTVSVGVTQARDPCSFQQLYRHADAALYAAKQGGRDRVVVRDIAIAGKASPVPAEPPSTNARIDPARDDLPSRVSRIT
ncbi:diguanylate cyclase domain-containing protein [Hephaestia sp. GCM10023244]|uniref:GGDEF domain-containing protein n=1 Tax=unclassified Hephaestia TaxID=2631281 RepID=UPI0020776F14|nr:GGDEF domain-containing protein [Hephaestia sp. MAHUQ-44]MCM8730232.1 GGDEF domain-containing protein [Hephaestia sp. MAHUQ-44]